MRTLLIPVFDSNMVRNILRTDVLSTLQKEASLSRIILLVHASKLEAYRHEFGNEKILLDTYPLDTPTRAELLTWFMVRHAIHTKNVRAKISEFLFNPQDSKPKRLMKFVVALAIFHATRVRLIDRALRRLAMWAHSEESFSTVIEKYDPDLVFLPTTFGMNDVRLLKYCISRNIPTVGMIKSWDNLLGKDPLLFWPDRLIVHNELVKGYAMDMHGYPEERIFVSGIPQMDVYVEKDFAPPREEFLKGLHLDPDKMLIVYTAVGILISYHEVSVIRTITDIVSSGELEQQAQLLVRLHPAYPSDDEQIRAIPGITIVRPGHLGAEGNPLRFDFEFLAEDTRALVSTMKYADVVLQSGSTIAIDAACFDTPIISIGFDGDVQDVPERSARRLLIKDHFKMILDTGGTRPVFSREELVSTLNGYLADRSLDRTGRERIVREQCYKLDGQSGKRIGDYLLTSIQEMVRHE